MEENKNKKEEKINKVSELRHDPVTGDWVIIANGRGKRPDAFKQNRIKVDDNVRDCAFCQNDPSKDILIYKREDGSWSLRVVQNKYPAVAEFGNGLDKRCEGLFETINGEGTHEVIITADHRHQLGELKSAEIAEVLDAYQERYVALMNHKHIKYISIFQNHGKEAGASLGHPHSQLLAIPVVSPGVNLELCCAHTYFLNNNRCIYCAIINQEKETKERVVFENANFIVIAPFASRAAFEMWVLPKDHRPYFERISQQEKLQAAEALRTALAKICKGLNDPAYNFYLHTSPCDGEDYYYFHWHIEILPKTSIWAGFELATGVEISAVKPEEAAEFLREQKI